MKILHIHFFESVRYHVLNWWGIFIALANETIVFAYQFLGLHSNNRETLLMDTNTNYKYLDTLTSNAKIKRE